LFGTRSVSWTPLLPGLVTILQVALLLVGLIFSISMAYRIGRQHAQTDAQAWLGTLPVSGFLAGTTLTFLWLYLG
jgi:hypothetical protein